MVLFLKVYWKAYLALFRPLDSEQQQKKQTKTEVQLVSIAAVFRLVTQPLSDEPKNGCEGD